MACSKLTAAQIKTIVIAVVKSYHPTESITPATTFVALGDDSFAKRRYWMSIDWVLESRGCDFAGQPSQIDPCKTVGDLITLTQNKATC
jgi:hypothetical protein